MKKAEFLATKFLKECQDERVTLKELNQIVDTMQVALFRQRSKIIEGVGEYVFVIHEKEVKA